MKKFLTYYRQRGYGCDYTIGCGLNVKEVQADSIHAVHKQVMEELLEEFSPEEPFVYESITIYKIAEDMSIDIQAVYQSMLHDRDAQLEVLKEMEERALYEKLKKKYE